MTVERRVLLNPGPATTTESVKEALVIPDICPREASFCELYADTRIRLARLVGDPLEAVAIPVVGNGTTALEAAMTSFVPADGRLLVLDNGDYGTRLASMARALNVDHAVLASGWGEAIEISRIEGVLRESDRPFTHAYFVHHETSCGILNPLEELSEVFRRHGVRTLLDAMSSFACLPTPVGSDGVDVLVSSSNKCVQGMAGLGIVITTRQMIDAARLSRQRCFALDLVSEYDHLSATGQSRFTVPPQIVSALHQALQELEVEGRAGRQARYEQSMDVLLSGLKRLGFRLLETGGPPSRILVAIEAPGEGWFDFDRIHDELFEQGFTIYPGKPGAAPNFRLSVLGAIDQRDVKAFLRALEQVCLSARSGLSSP
ncbi:MAG: 2-aminoethylphosphonate--pyruvate transaminase [Myxococcota bacterium]|nr:2-aminoethylphosphonate--pyruvate transaminase [Myxococcota bacterium]